MNARQEERRREAIERAATQLRKEAAKAGHQITQEQASDRVKSAVRRVDHERK